MTEIKLKYDAETSMFEFLVTKQKTFPIRFNLHAMDMIEFIREMKREIKETVLKDMTPKERRAILKVIQGGDI